MKTQEIRSLGSPELKKRLDESYRELLNLRFRLSTRQIVDNTELRRVRKRVARIKTVLRERELTEEG
ncbi:MAG: 50S ribosomal protein L29 [Chloroflexota bacterium]|nr:50S ribosomal protein L29 [Chloroflexota bacterium]